MNPSLPTTERPHPRSRELDRLSVREGIALMLEEEQRVVRAVAQQAPRIARAVEAAVAALRGGGRLFYVGAGTSGRLGVLDAAECPPTFSTPPRMVQGIIAGGTRALVRAREGIEDRPQEGAKEIRKRRVRETDMVLGISALGVTPFVLGALREAKRRGATVWLLTCNRLSDPPPFLDGMINPVVGPEILTGSTRLKAGTATKLVLNMLSTLSMVRLGKVYGNLMVDVAPHSRKLVARARRIIQEVAGVDAATAARLLRRSGRQPKVAIVMHRKRLSRRDAERLLARCGGFLREALDARSLP